MGLPVKLAARLEFDSSGFSRGADDAKASLLKLKGAFDVDLLAPVKYATAALVGLAAGLVGIGVASVKASMEFNRSMANVASLIPGNTARVVELKAAVQDLSVQTGKSTSDIAQGLYQSISAWGDTADTVDRLKINSDLATAGVSTLKEAIDLTSAVTRGYNDTSTETTQKVANLAALTVQLGQTTLPELAGSIGRVTPLTAGLGVSMEELNAVFASATGVTGGAAEVSTQFRGALQALLAPTDDLTKLMQGLGYESGKELIASEGLQGSLKLIADAAEESGTPLQKFIGSIEGQTLAMFLAGQGADDYTAKLAKMQNADGTLAAAVNEQRNGLAATAVAWDRLSAQVTVSMQKVGDVIGENLGGVFDSIREWLDANDEDFAAWVKGIIGWVKDTLIPALQGDGPAMTELKTSLDTFWDEAGESLKRAFDRWAPIAKEAVANAFIGLGGTIARKIWEELKAAVESRKNEQFVPPWQGQGSSMPHGASGGLVSGPGTSTSDSVLAALSKGEYVTDAKTTGRHLALLKALPGMASGGMVGPPDTRGWTVRGGWGQQGPSWGWDPGSRDPTRRTDQTANWAPFYRENSGGVAGVVAGLGWPTESDAAALLRQFGEGDMYSAMDALQEENAKVADALEKAATASYDQSNAANALAGSELYLKYAVKDNTDQLKEYYDVSTRQGRQGALHDLVGVGTIDAGSLAKLFPHLGDSAKALFDQLNKQVMGSGTGVINSGAAWNNFLESQRAVLDQLDRMDAAAGGVNRQLEASDAWFSELQASLTQQTDLAAIMAGDFSSLSGSARSAIDVFAHANDTIQPSLVALSQGLGAVAQGAAGLGMGLGAAGSSMGGKSILERAAMLSSLGGLGSALAGAAGGMNGSLIDQAMTQQGGLHSALAGASGAMNSQTWQYGSPYNTGAAWTANQNGGLPTIIVQVDGRNLWTVTQGQGQQNGLNGITGGGW